MSEYTYEGMFLLDSNRYAADPEAATASVMGMLDRCGATVVAHRPWQENKLTYPIKGHRKGLYYLACFKMDGSKVDELTRLGKLNETVLRQMVINHPQVVFDAMVDALSHDGAIHSPEQRQDPMGMRDDMGPRGEKPTDFE
ncbi:ribosomal protein S6 [Planctopirus limnophila DSM 3776]|uniref:Small ribosomal subunit protein bS6 n=1 Tax=Planctopirus limnophila (strain ATCC 43296 / DSM 3776 / IFAM 1008 / Mu 290) TaxID=521674 RepID=D5SQI9_PLAL2|nr:30S ribosomal protein S6 [Planctopirus limnophila]ADG68451.1 ribosomal protein S6 [Planctopirus limnophila DSM 3776]